MWLKFKISHSMVQSLIVNLTFKIAMLFWYGLTYRLYVNKCTVSTERKCAYEMRRDFEKGQIECDCLQACRYEIWFSYGDVKLTPSPERQRVVCPTHLTLWLQRDDLSLHLNYAHRFGLFCPVVARNSEVLGSNPGWVQSLSSGLCIYSASNYSNVWRLQCCLCYCTL